MGFVAAITRAVAVAPYGSSLRATRPSNKGMKQTSVEHIGRSQLIPGVRRTERGIATNASEMAPAPGRARRRSVWGVGQGACRADGTMWLSGLLTAEGRARHAPCTRRGISAWRRSRLAACC
jgi:hypothetical protein